MRLIIPLLFLAPALLTQEPAAPTALSSAEPPQRYSLRCGEETVEFDFGVRFTLPEAWAGRECELLRLPLRRFEYPGALAFDYPDGARWSAALHVPEFLWWHVGVDREFAMLQRHRGTGDGAAQRELYADNCVKGGGSDLGACTILLGGLEIRGRRVGVMSDEPYVQEIFGFEHAGETWLLVLNHQAAAAARPLRDRLLASFRLL